MALIKLKDKKSQDVVDDLIHKCLQDTLDRISKDSLAYSLIMDDEDLPGLAIISAVAIGLLGSVLYHNDCSEELKKSILVELMGAISHAEEKKRSGGRG